MSWRLNVCYECMHTMVYFPLKSKYEQLTVRKYFMHAKMTNNPPSLRYIKDRPWDAVFMPISGNRKCEYRTASMFGTLLELSIVSTMYNKEVSTALKEMSTILILLCIKLTQKELSLFVIGCIFKMKSYWKCY